MFSRFGDKAFCFFIFGYLRILRSGSGAAATLMSWRRLGRWVMGWRGAGGSSYIRVHQIKLYKAIT
jgi:hypothetical protein